MPKNQATHAKNSTHEKAGQYHPLADNEEVLAEAESFTPFENFKAPAADPRQAVDLLSKTQTVTARQQVFRSMQRTYGNRQATVIARMYNSGKASSTEISRDGTATSATAPASKINEEKAKADLEKVMARIAKYPSLNKPEFKDLFPVYVEMLRKDDKAGARQTMKQMLDYLDNLKAFKVDKKFFKRADRKGDKEAIEDYAKEAVNHVQLWSKLNKYMSMHEAEKTGGVSLEGSLAGSIFDDLDFGAVYNDKEEGNILADQWREISARFMKDVKGIIHARVFMGIVPGSVLTNTEWPKIKTMLENKQVMALIIHIFKMKNIQGELEEVPPGKIVTDEVSWNALPRMDDQKQFFRGQQFRAHFHQLDLEEQRKQQKRAEKEAAQSSSATGEQVDTSKAEAEADQMNNETPVLEPLEQEAEAASS